MKGSAAKQGHLHCTFTIMLAIQLVISTVATHFLKYIPGGQRLCVRVD